VAGERVKLLGSEVVAGEGAAGDVLGGFTIACGEGAITVTRAQRAGKQAMSAAEVLKGLDLGRNIA
jgi:methionyl-tRNA formyltransferase